jgi:hypothetical protein
MHVTAWLCCAVLAVQWRVLLCTSICGNDMAEAIEIYKPTSYRTSVQWTPQRKRGKVLHS